MENCCQLPVAGDVFDGVLFCAVLFPRDVLDEISDVPENFPTSVVVFKHTFVTPDCVIR